MTSPTSSMSTSSVDQSDSQDINALISGYKWGGVAGAAVTLSYSFPWTSSGNATFSGPNGYGDYSILNEQNASFHYGLNTNQQEAARNALQSWADVANIVFSEVAETNSDVGDIRFAWTSASMNTSTVASPWGWASYPNSDWPSGGDIWISTVNSNTSIDPWGAGSYNFEALIHEVGHALGLKHPFEGDARLPASMDNKNYTLMSYTEVSDNMWLSCGVDNWFTYPVRPEGPMLLDIAAIQYLYGANTSYHSGNDTYAFDATEPFYKTIWDAGGTDTISASNYTLPCVIDLIPGNYSSLRIILPSDTGGAEYATYDGANALGIAYGCIIENAIGGGGDDTLIGNSSNNKLIGGEGSDTVVFTGNFIDYNIFYDAINSHYTITDTMVGRDGSDDILSVEYFKFADTTLSASQLLPIETTAPNISSFNPADGDTGASTTANIEIIFDEAIQIGSGNIVLKTAAGAIVETFDVATGSDQILVSGATLIIDPTNPLTHSTNYYVTLEAGAIKDLVGNAYEGTTSYDFTTVADTTAPTVIMTDNLPGTAGLTTASLVYTLAFSESVSGLATDDFLVSNGTVASVSGTGNAWAVNVTPALGVANSTISLTLKAGSVSDASGNLNQIAANTTQAIDTVAPVAPKLVTSSAFNYLIDPQVTLQTSLGTVALALNPEQAPITVANMLAYVDSGFYDGTLFHRVIPDFMIQGGGFTTGLSYKTPTYGPITLESNNGMSNLRGTLAMARTSVADSATTQFFVNQADNTFLDYKNSASPGYAVFGEVVSGLSVIDDIARVATVTVGSLANVPVGEVTITSIEQTLSGSCITNAGTLEVIGLEAGAQWVYSLDSGAHWSTGGGSSFVVPVGNYTADAIQVKQTDVAGNTSADVGKLTSALVVDMTAPTISGFSPIEGTIGISTTANLAFHFSEALQRGAGSLVLKTAAGAIVETFDAATSEHLSISGSTLTIDPINTLSNNTEYSLDMVAGTVKDLAGNATAETTTYHFTTASGQILNGTTGNDALTGGFSNDSFNGGDGVDTIILSGLPSQYKLIGDTLTGIEGTDTLSSIEQFRFGSLYVSNLDATALTDPDGDGLADSPAKDMLQGISDLYVAYFNRAPDVDGLMYWFREVMNGSTWTLPTIAQSFTDQAEYRETYSPGLSNREFISAIYQNLFDRAPDAAGWDYWENDLNHGGVPRDVFIYSIIQGAYAPSGNASDKALLNNKHDVSLYYSEQLATSAEGFDPNITQVLNRVNADVQTVAKAEAVIDYVIDNPVTLTGLTTDTPDAWEAFWV